MSSIRKKRMKVRGKIVWVKPTFVKVVTHKMPDGTLLNVKAGTQVIDRFWRQLRSQLEGSHAPVGSSSLRHRVRSAQWVYWNTGKDLWKETGEMLRKMMS